MKELSSFNLVNYINESKIPDGMLVMILSEFKCEYEQENLYLATIKKNELVFLGTADDAVCNSRVKSISTVAELTNVIVYNNIVQIYVRGVEVWR